MTNRGKLTKISVTLRETEIISTSNFYILPMSGSFITLLNQFCIVWLSVAVGLLYCFRLFVWMHVKMLLKFWVEQSELMDWNEKNGGTFPRHFPEPRVWPRPRSGPCCWLLAQWMEFWAGKTFQRKYSQPSLISILSKIRSGKFRN